YRFQPNNEINGLTMGGVGSGTTLEYVQVSYSLDDGFEWFGGTVNGKYLISFGSQDDDFDTDFGYRGNLQFLVSIKDPNVWDSDASNGFESDNDASGTAAVPFTSAAWSNVTVVGPLRFDGATPVATNNHQDGLRLRRNTQLKIYNSVVMGFGNGVNVDGASTVTNATAGNLILKSTSVQSATAPLKSSDLTAITTWFTAAGSGNTGSAVRNPSALGFVDTYDLYNLDLRPTSGSELATAGTNFTDAAVSGAFFTPVSYRGAFNPSKARSEQWDAGWTDYNPNLRVGSTPTSVETIEGEVPRSLALEQNFPNPFNPSTVIRFALPGTEMVKLKVYDLLGREVASLVNDVLPAGQHQVTFDARGLSSGTYLYLIEAGSLRQVKRMTLIK
ncbi:MAG: T9SS type A sorting domain-containing protein, partial [Bacteroidetes bacterium]|nr:T9SS type A sorting domain-containing protein [Bacteroidota bacterium]